MWWEYWYRQNIDKHFLKILISVSISIRTIWKILILISISTWSFLKISISIWTFLNISISISISIREFCKISISIKYRIDWNLAYRTGLCTTVDLIFNFLILNNNLIFNYLTFSKKKNIWGLPDNIDSLQVCLAAHCFCFCSFLVKIR